ncbi:exopolysaccharide biosynthesis polyprenyl glycosylphosphotransferase [uncultured Anaerovibrio sp.]|uniref:exopolysaccharide biosynthesis polyprenyl glycosylphosphotransferase n=1 Tax=uncultured Anaerovibrio sp. TaxID=361586 RepID=UPI00262A26D8|nr:exopolysaccharide biosynthesis polyprenyl glycosylphosphotransferase [uncultured Anaerovibrio sp.]
MQEETKHNSSAFRHYTHVLVFMAVDYAAVVLAQLLSYQLCILNGRVLAKSLVFSPEYQYIYIPVIFILCIGTNHGYRFNRPSMEFSRDVFKGVVFGIIMCGILLFAMHESLLVSRAYAAFVSVSVMLLVAVFRYGILKKLKTMPILKENLLIIGAGKTAERIKNYFDNDIVYRYNVVGLLDDHPISEKLAEEYPLLGGIDDSIEVIQREEVKSVLVAIPGMEHERMNVLLADIRPYVRNILFAPDLVGTPMGRVHIHTLFSQQITLIKSYNDMSRTWNKFVKRSFDLISTTISLPIIIPVLTILGIIIKLDSKGSVFYNAERMGEGGKSFTCYKFRSMYTDGDERLKKYLAENPEAAAEWKEFAKLRGYDPRVTKCGKWMRRLSLDEFPQLINVLEGTMSLVGPRPYLPREKADIGADLDTIILSKPGITGFWQVNGRNDVSFAARVAMDVWYVNNWSFARDIMFLLKTVKIVFDKNGAY